MLMQPRTREEARKLGVPEWMAREVAEQMQGPMQAEAAIPAPLGRTSLFGSSSPDAMSATKQQYSAGNTATPPTQAAVGGRPQLPDSSNQPQTTIDDMVGPAPERKRGFWNGDGKFTLRDGVATALAVVGDAFAQQGGQKGTAVAGLGSARKAGHDDFVKAAQEYAEAKRMAAMPGMTTREFAAWKADPKAWAGHMSDAYSSHHAAANVNPGDQRVYGNPNAGGTVYQAPTAAEQYASDLGLQPGTADYTTALQDYTLRANGPTAFGYDKQLDDWRTGNDLRVEGVRQGNRMTLEGARQGNRMETRGAPTYRDLNPPAPRAAAPRRKAEQTATGPNGETIYFRGGKWVDAQGRAVQ